MGSVRFKIELGTGDVYIYKYIEKTFFTYGRKASSRKGICLLLVSYRCLYGHCNVFFWQDFGMESFIANLVFTPLRIFILVIVETVSKIRLCHSLRRVLRIPELHPTL